MTAAIKRAIGTPAGKRFCIGLTLLSVPSLGLTQDTSTGLEEVIVTARKQTESLMKVPVTAAAVSAEDLVRHQINNVDQLGTQIAAIRFDETAGGGGGTLTVRGIGSSTSDNGVDNTVATVFDGLQTSKGQFTKVGFLDLEQVEVLKGPQALFFGKNSPGGVLSLRSAGPTDELEGYARAGFTSGIDEQKVEGAISGPLGGNFRARLAASYGDLEGWVKNTVQDTANPFFGAPGAPATLGPASYDKNWVRETLARLTIDYRPSDDFSATFRLGAIRNRGAGRSANGEIVSCGGPATTDFLSVPDPYNDCLLNHRSAVGANHPSVRGTDATFPENPRQLGKFDGTLTSLTLELGAGPVDITSVTGYMEYNYLATHQSATSFGYGSNGVDEDWYQFSQELRLVTNFDSPVNFAGGVYYDKGRATNHGPNLIFPLPADPRNGSFFTYVFDGRTTAESYSVFGQLRWGITDNLEFDVGGRYSRDERTGDIVHSFVNLTAAALGFLEQEGLHRAGEKTYSDFSPEATLTWTASPNTIVFGSYRTGYKPGQSGNPNIVSVGLDPENDLFYRTETVEGFEIGFKSQLLDNTLRLTGAAFTYDYDSLQVSNFDSTSFVLAPLAGDMKTEGAELTVNWRVIPALRVNGAVAYTKARWTDFTGVACYSVGNLGILRRPNVRPFCDTATNSMDLTGLPKFRSPDWSGNLGFAYEIPAFSNFVVELTGNVSFVSKYNSQENASPFANWSGYELYDAGISARTEDGRLEFAVIGKNLSDEKYVGATYDQANSDRTATLFGPVGRPRTVVIQATYRY